MLYELPTLCCIKLISGLWAKKENENGIYYYSFSTSNLDDCKQACIDRSECLAINWEPNLPEHQCKLVKTTDTWHVPGITHYVVDRHLASEFFFIFYNNNRK